MKTRNSNRRRSVRRLLGIALALTAAARFVGAEDLPTFQPGLWTFTINIVTQGSTLPHTQTMRRCANPSEDVRKKWQALALETCKFSPVSHSGNHYSYSSTCQKEGMQLSLKATITVESEQAYRVDTESRTNNQVRKETLIAKREGDCAKEPGHMPVPQPRKDPQATN
ncbi:MAG: DUF3617 domain-containing protein [Steroidobacterales bacterium]